MKKITTQTSSIVPTHKARVALVHDWLTGYRGGEKVLEELCKMFPEAPLYTLVHIKGSVPAVIENRRIVTSFINKLPFAATKYRHYLPLFPLAAETLINEKYDVIISTSHAVAKSIRTQGTVHWCYIHSPMRYVWDRFDDYFGAARVGWLASFLFFKPIAFFLRVYDKLTSSRVTHYVANSHFVAKRVSDFYSRKAEVICPPVDTEKFSDVVRSPQDYYLFFSALVPYKRADLAIKACQKIKRKLIILGDGPELHALKKIADPHWTTFKEKVSDQELKEHFAKARALLFPAIEDFGIVPVEALAAGLPVIGLRAGGLLDSQDEKTCVFFDKQTVEGLATAISEFESRGSDKFPTSVLRQKAEEFSNENFKNKIQKSLETVGAFKKI